MKVRIAVQMHLEGVEDYYYSDIESYNEFLNDRLYSYAEIESISDLENHFSENFEDYESVLKCLSVRSRNQLMSYF